MASSKLDFQRFLPAPSCRSIVVIRLGSLFKSELWTMLLNSGNPQSGLDHFLNSGLQGSPKFTRANFGDLITKIYQSRQERHGQGFLIIDAMDLLHSGSVGGFCIVSSDSDFTGLAKRNGEQELFMMGIGRGSARNPSKTQLVKSAVPAGLTKPRAA